MCGSARCGRLLYLKEALEKSSNVARDILRDICSLAGSTQQRRLNMQTIYNGQRLTIAEAQQLYSAHFVYCLNNLLTNY